MNLLACTEVTQKGKRPNICQTDSNKGNTLIHSINFYLSLCTAHSSMIYCHISSRRPGERSNGIDKSWKVLKMWGRISTKYATSQLEMFSSSLYLLYVSQKIIQSTLPRLGCILGTAQLSGKVKDSHTPSLFCRRYQKWLQRASRTSKVSLNGSGSALGDQDCMQLLPGLWKKSYTWWRSPLGHKGRGSRTWACSSLEGFLGTLCSFCCLWDLKALQCRIHHQWGRTSTNSKNDGKQTARGALRGLGEKPQLSCSVPMWYLPSLGRQGCWDAGLRAMKKVFLKQEHVKSQD